MNQTQRNTSLKLHELAILVRSSVAFRTISTEEKHNQSFWLDSSLLSRFHFSAASQRRTPHRLDEHHPVFRLLP